MNPCDLPRARDKARGLLGSATGDVIVQLAGGLYELESGFALDSRDGGRPGVHMVYQAAPGQTPVLSGGRRIEGWKLFDSHKNIWAAPVAPGLSTRQLYVNGIRSLRARSGADPKGFEKTRTGFRSTGSLEYLAGSENLEVVSRFSWKEYRCPVDSISLGEIRIAQPCWSEAQAHSGFTMDGISWFENAYVLLDEEREWFLDPVRHMLYYKPGAGENLSTARVVAPVLESLLIATGTSDLPLLNLKITGLTFAYATWLQMNTGKGFPDLQSTYMYGDDGYGGEKIPSSIAFWFTDSLVLERNVFTALGGNGPALEAGCRNSRISGNRLFDISGNGMHIGNIIANPGDPRERVTGNIIENNSVTRIGQEYHGASGIFLGYVSETNVLYNEISDVPYTGISLGWGWGRSSGMGGNEVAFNHIHHHMNTMSDGGGIYTLGAQPGTRIHHNYVHDQEHEYGALYPDEGSSFMLWDSNVVQGVGRWFFMANGNMHGNTILGNYTDTPVAVMIGEDCRIDGNMVIQDGIWPRAALNIIAGAGLEKPYRESPPIDKILENAFASSDDKQEASSIRESALSKPRNSQRKTFRIWIAPGYSRDLLGKSVRP
jgi:hypothetical protein